MRITVNLFPKVVDDLETGKREDTRELQAIVEEFELQLEPAFDPEDEETKTQFFIRAPKICGNTVLQLLTKAEAVERIYSRSEEPQRRGHSGGGCGGGMGGMTALFVGGGG
jgi:hypothetical protein